MRLQKDFYHRYSQCEELSWQLWEAMHTIFPTVSTRDIFIKLSIGDDGEIIVLSTFERRWVETQYLGPSKVKDKDVSESEHAEMKYRWDQITESTLLHNGQHDIMRNML